LAEESGHFSRFCGRVFLRGKFKLVLLRCDDGVLVHDVEKVDQVEDSGDGCHDAQRASRLVVAPVHVLVGHQVIIPRETRHSSGSDECDGGDEAEDGVQMECLDGLASLGDVGQEDEGGDDGEGGHRPRPQDLGVSLHRPTNVLLVQHQIGRAVKHLVTLVANSVEHHASEDHARLQEFDESREREALGNSSLVTGHCISP